MTSVARHFIGVDLHKTVLQFCVVDDRGNILHEQRVKILPDAAGALVFDNFRPWEGTCRLAVEAVGMNRWFVNGLLERGCDVVVADPIKLNLKMLGKKTDKRDARELARRLWLGDIDRDAKTWYPDETTFGDRKLVRTRQRLMKHRLSLNNEIRAQLRAYNISPPARDLHTKKGIAGLLAMQLPNEAMTVCVHELTRAMAAVEASIAVLTEQIEKRVAGDERMRKLLDQLPSMGSITTLTLLSELGDVHRFRNAKAIASSGGVVPRVYQSADTAHHGRMTKRGSRSLRSVLGQWSVRLMSRNEEVLAWAAPRKQRLHKNKVRMALARKLLVGVAISLRRDEPFDLRRCLGLRN
jgi:transposase